MHAIAITTEQASRYHAANAAMRFAASAPPRTREAAGYTPAVAEVVAVVMEVAKANEVNPDVAHSLLDALALTDPPTGTRALTTEETDAYLRGHLTGYRTAVETEEGVIVPLDGEDEDVLSAIEGYRPLGARTLLGQAPSEG